MDAFKCRDHCINVSCTFNTSVYSSISHLGNHLAINKQTLKDIIKCNGKNKSLLGISVVVFFFLNKLQIKDFSQTANMISEKF